jgi:hypothetical protein
MPAVRARRITMTDVTLMNDRPVASNPERSSEAADLLTWVDQLLREGRPREALDLLPGTNSPCVQNARGVCLLRLGRPREAIDTLRDLVFGSGGLAVRPNADAAFQANYATALLLDGNAEGFWGVLGRVRDRTHPAVARLDGAIRRWKAGMTFWQRVGLIFGIGGQRLTLDVPPGDLGGDWSGSD